MANLIRQFCIKKSTSFVIFNSVLPSRTYSSALFIPGNKANKTFAYITPNADAYNNYFDDIEKLQKELDQRGIKIDVEELNKSWKFYRNILANRYTLEKKLTEVNKELGKYYKEENPSPEDLKNKDNFQLQNKVIKEDLRAIKEDEWKIEETVMPQILKLPNTIDERTPIDSTLILKCVGEIPNVSDDKKQNHMEIGNKLGLIEYKNPIQCYLCDNAALFELEALALAGKVLNEMNFIRVAGPDFSRSITVEGSGMDHESPTETFFMQNDDHITNEQVLNHLHLVGGASLPALLGMYTKHTFKPYDLPLRIFTSGRQYTPFPNSSTAHGLFSVCQASAIQALMLFENNSKEYKTDFEKLIEATSKIYDEIGCHYRMVVRPVKELGLAETIRVSFEMWSVHINQYIEVGHISACGDYFSKRLMIVCPTKKNFSYPAAVTGTLLSVPRVLGCLLEENPDKFVIPEKLSEFLK